MKTKTILVAIIPLLLIVFLLLSCDQDTTTTHQMIQLTFQDQQVNATHPVWSPTGDCIFFSGGYTIDNEDYYGICAINPQGEDLRLILDIYKIIPPVYYIFPWAYSDDGYLLFSDSGNTYPASIYSLSPDGDYTLLFGGNHPALFGTSDTDYNLAYVDYTGLVDIGLYIADMHGSSPKLLVSEEELGWPSWSPDRSKVVFASVKQHALYILNVNTKEMHQIYVGEQPTCPRWSPDGQYIAFAEFYPVTEHREVYIIPASGGTPERLTLFPYGPEAECEGVMYLSWSPDGKWIAYDLGDSTLWKVSVD